MPWRRMREWKYSSAILDLGIRLKWVVNFTPRPLYLRGNKWVGARVGQKAMEKRKTWSCRKYKSNSPTLIPSLYRLSYQIQVCLRHFQFLSTIRIAAFVEKRLDWCII
jgi:hypothetical protein